jgi:hypothetical protein
VQHETIRLADGPHTRLTIVVPIVRPLDGIALEDQGGKVETKAALLAVPLVLCRILIETHGWILR